MKLYIRPTKVKTVKYFLFFLLVALSASRIYGQEQALFTQYISAQGLLNPAYTGTREAISSLLIYRNQWTGFEGAPITVGFNAHMPIPYKRIGVGLSVISDKIGNINKTDIMVAGSYRLDVSNTGKLSFGLQGGVVTYTDRSFNAAIVDPDDEHFLNGQESVIYPNFGFGLYFYTDKFFLGYSAPRLLSNGITLNDGYTTSSTSFNTDRIEHNFYGGYVVPISYGIDFKPTLLLRYVEGVTPQADIGANFLISDIFWVGVGYRTSSAITFLAEIETFENLYLGYSFDFALNDIRKYSNGTHEISLRYDLDLDIIDPKLRKFRFRSIRYF